jgi:hypothetical protein
MTHKPKNLERIRFFRRRLLGIPVTGGILLLALLLPGPLAAQDRPSRARQDTQIPNPFPFPGQATTNPPPERTPKQKEALLKSNFKEMKKHADQLAEMAQSLQKKIGQTNENVLSIEVVREAEEIEKLAKKIKNEAKGY